MADDDTEGMQVPVSWVDWEETPVALANQFICQFQQDEFVLSVGQMVTPALLGTPEQIKAQASEIEYVPIRTMARFGMTRARLLELVSALSANLENHEKASAAQDPRGGEQ